MYLLREIYEFDHYHYPSNIRDTEDIGYTGNTGYTGDTARIYRGYRRYSTSILGFILQNQITIIFIHFLNFQVLVSSSCLFLSALIALCFLLIIIFFTFSFI